MTIKIKQVDHYYVDPEFVEWIKSLEDVKNFRQEPHRFKSFTVFDVENENQFDDVVAICNKYLDYAYKEYHIIPEFFIESDEPIRYWVSRFQHKHNNQK